MRHLWHSTIRWGSCGKSGYSTFTLISKTRKCPAPYPLPPRSRMTVDDISAFGLYCPYLLQSHLWRQPKRPPVPERSSPTLLILLKHIHTRPLEIHSQTAPTTCTHSSGFPFLRHTHCTGQDRPFRHFWRFIICMYSITHPIYIPNYQTTYNTIDYLTTSHLPVSTR